MKKYKCQVCGYIYDPEVGDPDNGIEPGTAFEDLPDDWVCPLSFSGNRRNPPQRVVPQSLPLRGTVFTKNGYFCGIKIRP